MRYPVAMDSMGVVVVWVVAMEASLEVVPAD
jgi:hypothetical protein